MRDGPDSNAKADWLMDARTRSADDLALDDPLDLSSDESYMDEDSIRDLVNQIVREELQGELGERITRNVRRLVRREVQRALTLRDLD